MQKVNRFRDTWEGRKGWEGSSKGEKVNRERNKLNHEIEEALLKMEQKELTEEGFDLSFGSLRVESVDEFEELEKE